MRNSLHNIIKSTSQLKRCLTELRFEKFFCFNWSVHMETYWWLMWNGIPKVCKLFVQLWNCEVNLNVVAEVLSIKKKQVLTQTQQVAIPTGTWLTSRQFCYRYLKINYFFYSFFKSLNATKEKKKSCRKISRNNRKTSFLVKGD